ncbi:Uncharacterized protein TCM_031103 [Theobroma cacao]|uniref:Copia protein n=1 Tax=Theobroma cacao TaxID=3641 RepID=A0A061F7B4_THECC|nr:Uncharacterized protein TCM_031103 [Theobroma cacao]
MNHGRTKHIKVKFHSIREAVKDEEIQLKHCGSYAQLADIFTKNLNKERFFWLRKEIGVYKTKTKGLC